MNKVQWTSSSILLLLLYVSPTVSHFIIQQWAPFLRLRLTQGVFLMSIKVLNANVNSPLKSPLLLGIKSRANILQIASLLSLQNKFRFTRVTWVRILCVFCCNHKAIWSDPISCHVQRLTYFAPCTLVQPCVLRYELIQLLRLQPHLLLQIFQSYWFPLVDQIVFTSSGNLSSLLRWIIKFHFLCLNRLHSLFGPLSNILQLHRFCSEHF